MVQRAFEDSTFTDVLERMPTDIRQTLTFEQKAALSQALRESRRKHAVDIRFPIPLLFTQLYVVLFIGKDRRLSTTERIIERRADASRWGMASLLAIGMMVLVGAGLVGAYVAKSRAGIDLLPNSHASDVARDFGFR